MRIKTSATVQVGADEVAQFPTPNGTAGTPKWVKMASNHQKRHSRNRAFHRGNRAFSAICRTRSESRGKRLRIGAFFCDLPYNPCNSHMNSPVFWMRFCDHGKVSFPRVKLAFPQCAKHAQEAGENTSEMHGFLAKMTEKRAFRRRFQVVSEGVSRHARNAVSPW